MADQTVRERVEQAIAEQFELLESKEVLQKDVAAATASLNILRASTVIEDTLKRAQAVRDNVTAAAI